jgi:hypothetical protein
MNWALESLIWNLLARIPLFGCAKNSNLESEANSELAPGACPQGVEPFRGLALGICWNGSPYLFAPLATRATLALRSSSRSPPMDELASPAPVPPSLPRPPILLSLPSILSPSPTTSRQATPAASHSLHEPPVTLDRPGNRIRIAGHFLSILNLEFTLQFKSMPKFLHPNTPLSYSLKNGVLFSVSLTSTNCSSVGHLVIKLNWPHQGKFSRPLKEWHTSIIWWKILQAVWLVENDRKCFTNNWTYARATIKSICTNSLFVPYYILI